ncbi:MAG: hypothetical protein WD872_08545, partial [Pirellulaceae bacterium]
PALLSASSLESQCASCTHCDMNTNRYLVPGHCRRARFVEVTKIFWAGTTVFTGLLLGVLYCLLTNQVPV